MKKIIFIVLVSILVSSCFGLYDYGSDAIVDDYETLWVDIYESRSLKKGEILVPAYVFAVGYDSKYIYSKQHPLVKNATDKINRDVINYYIIERTESGFQDKPIFGPFNKTGFEKKCIELAIKNPEFDLTFPTKWHFD
ncbi:DUF3997 domain-containing protein [Flavobacterium phragmitis]|uniref:DUF3997 domain-containing protein n=1 Tax=Flavobacterium phragmitis TaxID=739143 RepID=A0A1I1TUI4_9FLAO|nr:DUF3997 domain-containing protein [Flavobacterium phragmitis]SFD62311.1 Protein of unknown function [Flavobacterium phragmitis]